MTILIIHITHVSSAADPRYNDGRSAAKAEPRLSAYMQDLSMAAPRSKQGPAVFPIRLAKKSQQLDKAKLYLAPSAAHLQSEVEAMMMRWAAYHENQFVSLDTHLLSISV